VALSKKRFRERDKVSRLAYVPAIASFIPLVGVTFGISAILWGSSKWRGGGKIIAFLGTAGIAFTILLYGGLFVNGIRMSNSMEVTEAQRDWSQPRLAEIMKSVEFYQLAYGEYPDSLHQLDEIEGFFKITYEDNTVTPPFSFRFWADQGPKSDFFYQRLESGSGYYLFGRGRDGEPFTWDDVYPPIPAGSTDMLGIIIPDTE
jgi:hypothetical protein